MKWSTVLLAWRHDLGTARNAWSRTLLCSSQEVFLGWSCEVEGLTACQRNLWNRSMVLSPQSESEGICAETLFWLLAVPTIRHSARKRAGCHWNRQAQPGRHRKATACRIELFEPIESALAGGTQQPRAFERHVDTHVRRERSCRTWWNSFRKELLFPRSSVCRCAAVYIQECFRFIDPNAHRVNQSIINSLYSNVCMGSWSAILRKSGVHWAFQRTISYLEGSSCLPYRLGRRRLFR